MRVARVQPISRLTSSELSNLPCTIKIYQEIASARGPENARHPFKTPLSQPANMSDMQKRVLT